MSGKDRRRYLTETVMSQEFLDWSQDNLENRLEFIADIETPTGFIHASDSNKYVGGTFYEALLVFPVVNRTVGDWLQPELTFSTLTLELSNVDGRYNDILPGGANYGSWVGKRIIIQLGLGEIASTYQTVYDGIITEVAGVQRSVKSISLVSRDRYDQLSVKFPTETIGPAEFPKIQDDISGKLKPVIYGDFTVASAPEPAIVPGYVVNGRDPFVTFKEVDVDIDIPTNVFTSINHCLEINEAIQFMTTGTLPTGISTGVTYYVINTGTDTFQVSGSLGGGTVVLSGTQTGSATFIADPGATRRNIKCLISGNNLSFFDNTQVWMKRSELYYRAPASEIVNIGVGNKTFEIKQNTGTLWVESAAYQYDTGDTFFVHVKGKSLAGFDNNIISQAKDILETYGGLIGPDFDSNWEDFRDKNFPAESNIAGFLSRVWINEEQPVITYALSMLEQVRLEAFIDRNQMLKISSLHFDNFIADPDFTIKNWDVVKDSFKPQLDEQNNFNRAQGTYDYHPDRNENAKNTAIFRNQDSIDQVGKAISKRIVFPNLYQQQDVEYNLIEILKMASAMFETIHLVATWRALLQDIGGFVKIDVKIGSTIFEGVPALIREIGADPNGQTTPMKVWSFALCPFPGYNPGYTGTVGGYTATIVQE
jgi:hypothetical protein